MTGLQKYLLPKARYVIQKRSQGGKGPWPPRFLTYLVVLCFERRCPKPNTLARSQNFGLATPLTWGNVQLWLLFCFRVCGFVTSSNHAYILIYSVFRTHVKSKIAKTIVILLSPISTCHLHYHSFTIKGQSMSDRLPCKPVLQHSRNDISLIPPFLLQRYSYHDRKPQRRSKAKGTIPQPR